MDYSRISELVKRAKYGDKLALEELIKSYDKQQLLKVAYSKRGSLKAYAQSRGITYRKCAYQRDRLVEKLRKMIK